MKNTIMGMGKTDLKHQAKYTMDTNLFSETNSSCLMISMSNIKDIVRYKDFLKYHSTSIVKGSDTDRISDIFNRFTNSIECKNVFPDEASAHGMGLSLEDIEFTLPFLEGLLNGKKEELAKLLKSIGISDKLKGYYAISREINKIAVNNMMRLKQTNKSKRLVSKCNEVINMCDLDIHQLESLIFKFRGILYGENHAKQYHR
jgi:hypothetical protein